MRQKLIEAISNIREKEALLLARDMLVSGAAAETVLDAAREAMVLIGTRFERKDFFLPELIIGGEILKQVADLVKPSLKENASAADSLGKVIIGTVAGDIHDIGKDIVAFMLDCNRFEVHDLGVNVTADRFVQAVREQRPDILAMSALMTTTITQQRLVIERLAEEGLRMGVKVIVGGGGVTQEFADSIGADGYDATAPGAARLARRLLVAEPA